jgi:hypothetical protein
MTMTNSKINPTHLTRQACIYIRQSTPGQVRFNPESTERQYNLMDKAQAFGWNQEQIRVLDGDLGHSGSISGSRGDFKILVGDVALGQVGAIFSLETSRLARSNQDWHRLLELCAITSNSKWGSWQFSGVSVLLNLRWLACGTCCTSVQGGLMAAAAMDRSR